MIELSIIIPMYNVEHTLHNSLDSLLKQTDKNFEVILVDDGSQDNTHAVAHTYIDQFSNFKYYYKENGGASSARNHGLKVAQGQYILFLDADDYYESHAIALLRHQLENTAADILCFGARSVDVDFTAIAEMTRLNDQIDTIDPKTIIINMLNYSYTNRVLAVAFNKVYKKEIIDRYDIQFCEDLRIGEDFVFNVEYFCHVHKVLEMNEILYNYYQSDQSLMRTGYDKFNILNVQKYKGILKKVFQKHEMHIDDKYIENFYISKFYGVVDNEAKAPSLKLGLQNVKTYCKHVKKKLSIASMTKKEKTYYIFIRSGLWYILFLIKYLKNKGGKR